MSPSDPPDGALVDTVLVPVAFDPTVTEFTCPVKFPVNPVCVVILPLTFIPSFICIAEESVDCIMFTSNVGTVIVVVPVIAPVTASVEPSNSKLDSPFRAEVLTAVTILLLAPLVTDIVPVRFDPSPS